MLPLALACFLLAAVETAAIGGTFTASMAVASMPIRSFWLLANLADEIRKAGSALRVVEARSAVRDRLHGERLEARLGSINRFISVADAVDAEALSRK